MLTLACEEDYHFVHNRVAKQKIQVHFIPSKNQFAVVLTKLLSSVIFTHFLSKLRVEAPSLVRGGILYKILY